MARLLRRVPFIILITIAAGLLALELMLRYVDPFGIYAYFADYSDLTAHALPAEDGIRYTPGTWRLRKYIVTIGLDGLRAVLSAKFQVLSKCRIVFVGDSVTFGMGSSTSFVDVLARDMDAHVINGGFPGYSAENVLAELDTIPADGYVWLIIQNDDEPLYTWKQATGGLPSAIELYRAWLTGTMISPPVNMERFIRYADVILVRGDVTSFAFSDGRLVDLIRQRYPAVRLIKNYTMTVSRYDVHPSPQGAVEIADAMHDAVMEFTKKRCHQE